MTKQKILITGASGLLGNRVAKAFSYNHDVFAIVRELPITKIDGITYIEMDLSSDQWNENALPTSLDTIFHLAQSDKFRDFPNSAIDVFNVNIRSTARLLDYARSISAKRFVYASSGGVYGSGRNAFVENSPITPTGKLGYYLGSKLCSEIIAESYSQIITVGILRFFFMYGQEQKRSMLIPRLVDRIKQGLPISIQGDEGIYINPIHVDDAVQSLKRMINLDYSCTMNIGGPDVLSIRQIATIIAKELGKEAVFENVPGEINNLIGDIELMKKNLGEPQIHFSQGVKDLL